MAPKRRCQAQEGTQKYPTTFVTNRLSEENNAQEISTVAVGQAHQSQRKQSIGTHEDLGTLVVFEGSQALHDLTHHENPDMLLLIETKLTARRLERIRIRIGMQGCLGMDNEGRGGGLALLWKDNLDTQLINFSQHHIHINITTTEGLQFVFIEIYGQSEASRHGSSCELSDPLMEPLGWWEEISMR